MGPTSTTSIRPELLGWRFVEMAAGRAVMEWTPGPDLANPAGFVHGGWVGALVDDVSGAALVSLLSEPRPFPTVSMHIEFIRPIPIGGTHTVTGVVVRAGK
ncbi:MAG TPA: PaaI family thioesterase, partial [Acidimicrobiia bacterium]|nr:PaaI family thioesterase [Acidimicrobiia bacterium]